MSDQPVTPMELLAWLEEGDRRVLGRVPEAIAAVRTDPGLFPCLFEGMAHDNEALAMRAADVMAKTAKDRPELLRPHIDRLLDLMEARDHQEIRWLGAQCLPRASLTADQIARATDMLMGWTDHKSKILQVMALQCLVDFCALDPEIVPKVRNLIQEKLITGSAAVRARCRKLLKELDKQER